MFCFVDAELNADDPVLGYKEMLERDYRRFKLADIDYDGILSFTEYIDFLHPEDAPHMREVVIRETLDDLDKNKDGKVNLEEYIGKACHIYNHKLALLEKFMIYDQVWSTKVGMDKAGGGSFNYNERYFMSQIISFNWSFN